MSIVGTDKRSLKKYIFNKKLRIIVVVILIAVLAYFRKNWFVAATVDGSPITTLQLAQRMFRDNKTATLNEMIDEKVAYDEALKQNALPSDQQISDRLVQIQDQSGGQAALQTLLDQQGMTKDSLKDVVRFKLTLENLYANDATVSSAEVSDFIKQNKSQLTATDEAGQIQQATDALKGQKLQDVIYQKFPGLKSNAKVVIFQ